MATNEQILDLLTTLDSVYGSKLEPGAIKAYYWALEEYDGDLLDAVGKDAVQFHKWYPKPAELREIAERKQRAKDKGEEPAKMYWRMVKLASDWLTYKTDDPKVEAAVIKYFGMDREPPPMLHHFRPDDIIEYDEDGYPIELEELTFDTPEALSV